MGILPKIKFTLDQKDRDRFLEVTNEIAQVKRLDSRGSRVGEEVKPVEKEGESLDEIIDATLANLCPDRAYLGADCASLGGDNSYHNLWFL